MRHVLNVSALALAAMASQASGQTVVPCGALIEVTITQATGVVSAR